MTNTPLSEKEIELIRKYLPDMTIDSFVKKIMPNRNKTTIRRYAAKLNVRYLPVRVAPWSDKEESIVKKHYADKGVEETLFLLRKIGSNKTRKQLLNKASDLGIKISPDVMKKIKSDRRKAFLEKQESRRITLEAAKKAAKTRREKLEKESSSATSYRPKWKNESAKMCFYLLDRHWNGEQFEKGTKEYQVLKNFRVIGY